MIRVFHSLSTKSTSEENRIQLREAFRDHSCNWYLKYANESNLFLRLFCWMGLLVDSDNTLKRRITVHVFHAMLLLGVADCFVITFLRINDAQMGKVLAIYYSTYLISILTWYSMRYRRKQLTDLLRLLHKLHPQTERKEIDIILYSISCMPLIFAILNVLTKETKSRAQTLWYQYPIDSTNLQVIVVFIKISLYNVLYCMFPTAMILLHCVLCQRVRRLIMCLREEIEKCPPKQFNMVKQSSILRKKNKIDEVLTLLQRVLYLSSFLISALYFTTCCTGVGWLIVGNQNVDDSALMVQFSLYFVNTFACLLLYMWFLGCLPIEIDNFKEEFSRKREHRLLCLGKADEVDFQKVLCERPSFVVSGCDIMHFRRSSILALAGTVFTYTMLLITY
ncbi:uncharacterized protein NPIL_152041 [Nephila pilipes]|uniref:Uncharacterized protein n=1 Tax=Nephila pilipes TaxID=299642 RepID=A0A8X6NML2_NEPPI|nr:uncharacterized protein NPIL_152041 [Nephila pilipes]